MKRNTTTHTFIVPTNLQTQLTGVGPHKLCERPESGVPFVAGNDWPTCSRCLRLHRIAREARTAQEKEDADGSHRASCAPAVLNRSYQKYTDHDVAAYMEKWNGSPND
jgi:hypothetical protein